MPLPFTHKQLEFLYFVNFLEDWNYNKLPEIVVEIYESRRQGNKTVPFDIPCFESGTEFDDGDIYGDRVPLNEEEYQQLIATLQEYSPVRLFDLQSCLVLLTQF